jgi:hypothetical protein
MAFSTDLKNSLLLDKFIKEYILKNRAILEFLKSEMVGFNQFYPNKYCSFYGNYSYLSLVGGLEDELKSDNLVTSILEGDLKIENILKDLNFFVMEEEDEHADEEKEDIYTNWKDICNKLIDILKEIFGTYFKITLEESIEKKLFEANVFTIFIEKIKVRGKQDLYEKYQISKSPLFVFDIYKENIKLKELFDFTKVLPTLTLNGYTILSSFIYLQTNLTTLPVNKKRNINIINLYEENQARIFRVIQKCNELFGNRSKASQIFYQFLNHLEIPLEEGLTFSSMQSIFNTGILENNKHGDSLRQILNTFIYKTDQKLIQQGIGRFLKAGGEAYRHLVDEEVIVNDIDTKIFFNNPILENKNIVYQNIITSLYFIVQKINKENILRIEDVVFHFTFDDKRFTYKIGNNTRNDYITINCYEQQYISIVLTLNTLIESENRNFKFVSNLRFNPLDVWLDNVQKIVNLGPFVKENPRGPSTISKEYFIQDLLLSIGGNDIKRIAERIIKGKIDKDRQRYANLTEQQLAQIREEKNMCKKIMTWFGDFFKKSDNSFKKIKIIDKSKLDDLTITRNQYPYELICNLIWDEFNLFTEREAETMGYKQLICSCVKEGNPLNCRLSFSRFIKCSFIKLEQEQLQKLTRNLSQILETDSNMFINMILLSTKINELEYSLSQKVFINPTLYLDERNPDFKIDKDLNFCEIQSTITKDDYIFLEWYVSDSGQFASFNKKIRNDEELTYVEKIIYYELFKILRKGVIKKGTVLYRGIDIGSGDIRAGFYEKLSSQDTIINKSFISTSLNKGVALDFLKKGTKCCILKITLTEDIRGGIYLPSIGYGKNNENEILFLPGTIFSFKDTNTDFGNYKIFNFDMNNIDDAISYRGPGPIYLSQEEIEEIDNTENELREIEAERQTEEFKNIPALDCTYQTKINFINFFIKKDHDFTPQLEKLNLFIEMLNNRKTNDINRYFEDVFGKMVLKFLKKYPQVETNMQYQNYDFDTTLNSILTLERDLGAQQTTSIRQLLNQYISVINKWLKRLNFGTLYKTGGEATRYYTKANGDLISNDIDSKFCVKPDEGRAEFLSIRNDEVIRTIFPYITKTIIILAAYIKKLKKESGLQFDIIDITTDSNTIKGQITAYESDQKLIYNYIMARSNFVGCNDGKDIVTNNFSKDCMRIVSIDICYKIKLNDFFMTPGKPSKHLIFHITTAPYDFLISNTTCDDLYIKLRDTDNKPPIVSLKFIIKDLLNLFSPPGTGDGGGGDLEKRKSTGKHKKDKYRFIGLLRTIGDDRLRQLGIIIPQNHNILNNDFNQAENIERISILKRLMTIQDLNDIIDIENGNNNLDKQCIPPADNVKCNYLNNLLNKVLNNVNVNLSRPEQIQIEITQKDINKKSLELNKILDVEPKKNFRAYFN